MEALSKELTYMMFKFLLILPLVLDWFYVWFHSADVYCVTAGWVLWRIQSWIGSLLLNIEKEDRNSEKFSNRLSNMMRSNNN